MSEENRVDCHQCTEEIVLEPGMAPTNYIEMRRDGWEGTAHMSFCSASCLIIWMEWYGADHWQETNA